MVLVLAILAGLSALLTLWQWLATWRFPLHQRFPRHSPAPSAPAITVIKPLKGLDSHTIHCLQSWLQQQYSAPVQILFAVASEADPACPEIRRFIAAHPGADCQLVLCPDSLGINAKVSSLIQARRRAKHPVIVVSDDDVLVPPDFLENLVLPFAGPNTGLVNCFYRFANPVTLPMRLEAVAVNADFWSQVLQGRMLQPLDFALGAVMAIKSGDLDKIGGFESVADFLADDFQLGNRIARLAGKRIELCPLVVDCLSEPSGWREVWSHQLRWARTIRASKPGPYAASVLSNATIWPLLWAACYPSVCSWVTLAICLCLRIFTAFLHQRRLGMVPGQSAFWWLPPFKDLFQFAIWIGAFAGNKIRWRNQQFHLQRDGRLVPSPSRIGN